MDSVFIVVFLIIAPVLLWRQLRGFRWDWKLWASLAAPALLGVVALFQGLLGKPLPLTFSLPTPVASVAMVVLFILALAPQCRQTLDEVDRLANKAGTDNDRRKQEPGEEASRPRRPDGTA